MILFCLRPKKKEEPKVQLGWIYIVYGILLGVSIILFYLRYNEIRDTLISEVCNLEEIYLFFRMLPHSQNIINNIYTYSQSVIEELKPELENNIYVESCDILYQQLITSIIIYMNNYNSVIFQNNNILQRLQSNKKIKYLIDEISTTQYYIWGLWILFGFVLLPLFFISTNAKELQFLVDFCFLGILISGIYLCTILNNPFVKSPLQIDFSMYKDLLLKISKCSS
jgi:hypothetical protein